MGQFGDDLFDTKDAINSFFFRSKVIGKGTYGVVYEAIQKSTGQKVALKRIKLGTREDLDMLTSAFRELILLRELNHPCIVKFLDGKHINNHLWLSFELCDSNLKQYMCELGNCVKDGSLFFMPVQLCKSFSKQLLEGIAYCHSKRIFHRDLKPQNILLNKSGNQIKIADFGLARTFAYPEQSITHEVVTLWYRAPELLLGDQHYNSALDVWSAGCIIAEMATGKPLFHGDCEMDTLFRIFQLLGTPKDSSSNSPTSWKNVSKLPFFQNSFPQWKCKRYEGFEKAIPIQDALFIDLLSK